MYLSLEQKEDNFCIMEDYVSDMRNIFPNLYDSYKECKLTDKEALKSGISQFNQLIRYLEDDTQRDAGLNEKKYIKECYRWLIQSQIKLDDSAYDGVQDVVSDLIGDLYNSYEC